MQHSILLLTLFVCVLGIEGVTRPRGVPLSKAAFYKENEPFKCLDGSASLPWSKVNDDYCDCRDASDEPGTSACSNGLFFCENKNFKGMYIPSSRVNDGICDCCDGSDEYSGIVACRNECWEKGKAAREEAERRKKMIEEGHRVYQEYVEHVKTTLEAKRQRIDEIEKELQDVNAKKATVEEAKKEAEKPESEAKERHEKAWQEVRQRQQEERTKKEAANAFSVLDTDKDQQVTVAELQVRMELDSDSSGDVSEEEVKSYMDVESVGLDQFIEKVWPLLGNVYKKAEEDKAKAKKEAEQVKEEDKEKEKTDEEDAKEEKLFLPELDPESLDADTKPEEPKESEEEDKMPDYDESTKKLIEVADAARKAFDEVERKSTSLQNEKDDLKKMVERDYGPNSAFFRLADTNDCYEYTDREYIYRLCVFKETTQRPKDGGSDTSLGYWGRWSGPEGNVYSEMLYENGQSCWNGPNRSTRVKVLCGSENKVESASEPNRCEYLFIFTTPAACSIHPEEAQKEADHDEL